MAERSDWAAAAAFCWMARKSRKHSLGEVYWTRNLRVVVRRFRNIAKCDYQLRHDYPSVRMEQIGSHRTDFHETSYFGIFFSKICQEGTYLLYFTLLTHSLTRSLTYLLHGAESFLRS